MDWKKNIHILNFSRKLTVNTLFFLTPLYFLKIGFSGWQIGAIMSVFAIAPLVFSFPVGWMNDRLSIRRVIGAALLVLSLSLFGLTLNQSFIVMVFLFFGIGLANNALDVSTNSLYFKDESPGDINRKYGVYAFWLALGVAVGTLSAGFLIQYADFKVMFAAFSAVILFILVLVRDFGRETLSVISIKEYRLGLFNRKTLMFTLLIFIMTLHWGAEGTVYSPFLKSHFRLTSLALSFYISIPLFFLALSAFFIGMIRYKASINKRIFLAAMFFSGLGHFFMVSNSLYISFAFRVVHEIGDGFMGALIVLYISRLFEKKSIGGSSGVLLAVMTLGHMVGAVVFSLVGFKFGLHYPFLISGALLMANSGFGYYVFKKEAY